MKRIYISHPIRGLKGNNVTEEEIAEHNTLAMFFGTLLQDLYPQFDFYVPANHDEFPATAMRKGIITVEQILQVDCEIIKKCDGLILFNHEGQFSDGMNVEYQESLAQGLPHLIVDDIEQDMERIENFLNTLKD